MRQNEAVSKPVGRRAEWCKACKTAHLPWVAVAKMLVHRIRQYTGPGEIWNKVGGGGQTGKQKGGFLRWKAQLLQH